MHATLPPTMTDPANRDPRTQSAGRRVVMMFVVAAVILVGVLLLQIWRQALPQADSQAASQETLRAEQSDRFGEPRTLEEMIALRQARIARNATDHVAYAELGLLLLQRVRSSGDTADYARAEQALDAALAIEPQQVDALVGKGILALALHDFDGALTWADQARAINPLRPDVLGIMTDAYVELGDYEQAVVTLQAMMDMRPDLNSYTRTAYVRELHGDVDGAIQAMQMAAEMGTPGDEATLWTTVQLGHLHFNRGDLATAAATYGAALAQSPNYVYALAGMARVWAAEGRVEDAVAQYREVMARIPLPEFAIALGELLEATGDLEGARQQYELVEVMQTLNAASGMNVDLDMALFNSDHGADKDAALAQAEAAYAERQTIHTADVIAWALYQTGRADEAQPYVDEALRLGTQDARLFYRAGMIALAQGNIQGARQWLTRALDVNPYFSPLYAAEAAATLEKLP